MSSNREFEITIEDNVISLENIEAPGEKTIAVYTAIFSEYDDIPVLQSIDDRISYFIFTDGSITSAPPPWEIRQINSVFSDPQRDARRVKLLPHLFLPRQYKMSVWIDSSLFLRQLNTETIETILADADIAVTRHNQRHCIYDEAKAVLDVKYESPARVWRQMGLYAMRGFPEKFGLHATMFLARRHMSPKGVRFNHDWWSEVSRFSKRDQLSFDYVRWQNQDVIVNTLNINVFQNPLFGFKMTNGREHKSGTRVTSEHLYSRMHPSKEGAWPSSQYLDLYETYSTDFYAHFRNLNNIIRAAGEYPQEDILCSGPHEGILHSPPDPKAGPEREMFLRALMGRKRLFETSFGNGGRVALALTQLPISVTAVDDSGTKHSDYSSRYLQKHFGERLIYTKLAPETLIDIVKEIFFDSYDAIHIDASTASKHALHNLACAVVQGAQGAALIITGLGSGNFNLALAHLVRAGLLTPFGDLQIDGRAVTYTIQRNQAIDAGELLADLIAVSSVTNGELAQ